MAMCALTTLEPPTPCVVRQTPVHSRSTLKLKLKLKYRPDNQSVLRCHQAVQKGPALQPFLRVFCRAHCYTTGTMEDSLSACRLAVSPKLVDVLPLCELPLGCRQHVALAGHPHIQRRQQEDAHDQVGDQTADYYNCKRTLRVGTNRM